jgi:hypothetical protein
MLPAIRAWWGQPMSTSDILSGLFQKLEETGLADFPGKLLYSGIGTLCSGPLYVLGYNPGGDPNIENDSTKDDLRKLAEKCPNWNEYIDAIWGAHRRRWGPGDAPMQRRLCSLLRGIGLCVRTVCASNLIFVRSRRASSLKNRAQLAEDCWSVHQFILKQVRPKGMLSIGDDAFKFILRRGTPLSATQHFQSGHASWRCRAARVQLGTQSMAIVSVPHLAIYAIDHHPKVIDWVRTKLGL